MSMFPLLMQPTRLRYKMMEGMKPMCACCQWCITTLFAECNTNYLKERLLDQAQAQTPYTPFLGVAYPKA